MTSAVDKWVLGLGDLGSGQTQTSPSNPPPSSPSTPPVIPLNTGGPIGTAVYYNPPLTTATVGQANYSLVPNSPPIGIPLYDPHIHDLGTHPRFLTPTENWSYAYGQGGEGGFLPGSNLVPTGGTQTSGYPGQVMPSPIIGIANYAPTPVGPIIGKTNK